MIIGIVGCGGIAHAHVRALSLNKHVCGLAFYDVNNERMHQLRESSALPVTFCQELRQLAEMSDGFIICTPNHLHVSMAEKVMSYRKIPFVCEKPLSTDVDSAERMISISPSLSVVSFNYRYNRVVEMIIRLRRERSLGELVFFSAAFNKNSALTRNHITWRDSASQCKSSGALGDLACHLLDIFCLLGDSKIEMSGLRTVRGTRIREKAGGPVEVDDNGYVFGRSESGAFFQIHASKADEPEALGLHIHVVFEKGEIRYSTLSENTIFLTSFDRVGNESIEIEHEKILSDPPGELPFWSDSFIFFHQAWCELLKSGEKNYLLADLPSGLHIQEVIEEF
ncbi:MAG: Gfo/Idh/MocA family oxidoreductase [Pantoea sp.]|uniref:Gfo/Idh/MocA family protein n=1 Tax=Pantoea sp. TaxID=69393 RepID=UPI0039E34FD4